MVLTASGSLLWSENRYSCFWRMRLTSKQRTRMAQHRCIWQPHLGLRIWCSCFWKKGLTLVLSIRTVQWPSTKRTACGIRTRTRTRSTQSVNAIARLLCEYGAKIKQSKRPRGKCDSKSMDYFSICIMENHIDNDSSAASESAHLLPQPKPPGHPCEPSIILLLTYLRCLGGELLYDSDLLLCITISLENHIVKGYTLRQCFKASGPPGSPLRASWEILYAPTEYLVPFT